MYIVYHEYLGLPVKDDSINTDSSMYILNIISYLTYGKGKLSFKYYVMGNPYFQL